MAESDRLIDSYITVRYHKNELRSSFILTCLIDTIKLPLLVDKISMYVCTRTLTNRESGFVVTFTCQRSLIFFYSRVYSACES